MSDLNNQAATTTVSAPGEPVSATSVPAQPVLSGSISTPVDTPSIAGSIQTSDATPPTVGDDSLPSTTEPAGTVGEQGNALPASGDSKPDENAAGSTITDQAAADAAARVRVVATPPTDSRTGSPTGGPIAGRGDTPDAKAKHGLIERIEEDLRTELHAIEGLPHYVLHVLSAVFDRHHSHVDNQAAR